jgi:hypothetical protein
MDEQDPDLGDVNEQDKFTSGTHTETEAQYGEGVSRPSFSTAPKHRFLFLKGDGFAERLSMFRAHASKSIDDMCEDIGAKYDALVYNARERLDTPNHQKEGPALLSFGTDRP